MKWSNAIQSWILHALFKALRDPAYLYMPCSFQQSAIVGAERLAVRFVELASPWTVPTFSTSRETTGTGRLPDLIRLKDIQTDRLGEASDPLRFNLFGSIAAGWSLVDIGWNTQEMPHSLVLTVTHFLTQTMWVCLCHCDQVKINKRKCDNSFQWVWVYIC